MDNSAAMPALASWGSGWCGAVEVVLVCAEFLRFCDEVGNFFYNSDMRNSKTVMTGEAVDKLWISCG